VNRTLPARRGGSLPALIGFSLPRPGDEVLRALAAGRHAPRANLGPYDAGRRPRTAAGLTDDDLGYAFLTPAEPGRLGLSGSYALQVRLSAVPTNRHFDPEYVQLPAVEARALAPVKVAHPWTGAERFSVCVGHILVRDRRLKAVEALTFGGQAAVDTQVTHTVCTVTSPAPILHLVPGPHMDPEGAVTLLASEVEAILARRRASYAADEASFAARLGTAEPWRVYVAMLRAVRERLLERRSGGSAQDERDRLLASVVERYLQAAMDTGLVREPLPTIDTEL
jgi:hypothetical protein